MEAARIPTQLPELIRRRRFTAACEKLRPQGVAFVLRRFGGSLDRADAEDVVAEVIIRFDGLDQADRRPDRLRPAFFQSVRNAAFDLLRYRGVRPTAPLEAAEWQTTDAPAPEELAESHENVVRLREALARMRPNYREAIVLRFGLGLTVPEIAAQVGISLPAAKKLVLRSTAQIRARMEAIEDQSFCPEMREIAERSLLDGELAGIAEEGEAAAIKAHLEHCGPCRSFLTALRSNLHELGATTLLGGIASAKLGIGTHLVSHLHSALQGVQAGAGRARLTAYRLGGAFRAEGADSAGLLAGTGQKIAAACTAGAAGAATCVATGIVGPGIRLAQHHTVHHPPSPPAHVLTVPTPTRRVSLAAEPSSSANAEAPASTSAATPEASTPITPKPRHAAPSAVHQAKPNHAAGTESEPVTPEQTEESEFGIESESTSAASAGSTSTESSAPLTAARTVESTPAPSTSSSTSSSSSKASSAGHDEFGFGG
jgi:RNA polymerase sigma factor (sigma-70 family)